MEKDKLLKNMPLEMLGEIKKLASRLWEEKNPVAVPLSVIVEEFEAETGALESLLKDYEKHNSEKIDAFKKDRAEETEGLKSEIAGLKEQLRGLEGASKAGAAKIYELKSALEKSESAGMEKYTKDEVFLLERQILELKKEVGEFRQLKEMDDRRIMELEGIVATKAEEVERRYIGKTTLLETECAELKVQNAELEKSRLEDDVKIKEFRSALEKSERESREKYTRMEVDMLEQQILELKKEVGEFRQLKEMDDRRILELEGMVATKAEEVERRYIGRTTLLERESAELKTRSAELEKSKVEDDARIREFRSALEKSERESREKYTRMEVDMLEQQILELKKEAGEFRQLKDLDERKIAELDAMLEGRSGDIEKKYIGRAVMLEKKVSELQSELSGLEAVSSENGAKAAELKKIVAAKDRENMELKARLADAEMEANATLTRIIAEKNRELAEVRGNYISGQLQQGELLGKMGEDVLVKLEERKKEMEREYLDRVGRLKSRTETLEAEYGGKVKALAVRERAVEEDFAARKLELIKTFDRLRAELERRESGLAEREEKPKGPAEAKPNA